jgi:hypothetical protein
LKEREFELKKLWFKVFSSQWSGQWSEGAWTYFYSSQKESIHWGVRDLDMSNKETRYVQKMLLEPDLSTKMLLEPGLSTGHVQCWDLARVRAEGPDMSGLGVRYVRKLPLELGDQVG